MNNLSFENLEKGDNFIDNVTKKYTEINIDKKSQLW